MTTLVEDALARNDRYIREFVEALRLCADLRPQLTKFYCVAFHPDLPLDLTDAHRAVQFIRRSPDPTIQMVRASVLKAVRGRDEGTKVIDSSKLSLEQLMAISSPLS